MSEPKSRVICTLISAALALGLLLTPRLSLAQSVSYSYDELGRVTCTQLANGTILGFAYDAAGNRTQEAVQACGQSGGGLPDLTVSAAPTPTSATQGVATTLQGAVQNIGPGTASNFVNQFEMRDINNNCNAPYCDNVNTSSISLLGNSSAAVSAPYTFSSTGTYTVRICADINNTVTESNESNNCGPWATVTVNPPPAPDLTVTAAPTPTSATAGVATTVQGTVTNSGTAASVAVQNFFQFYDINHNCTTPNFCGSITTNTAALAAGASVGTSGSYTFPVAGTYTMRLCTNSNNADNETNTSDDCGPWATVTVAPAPAPDLTVTVAPTPTSATVGVATTFQGTVKNAGTASSVAVQNYFQFLDVNHNCTQPNFCGAIYTNTAALAAGASASTSGSYTFPVVGTYTTRLCTNNNNADNETNTSDDCGPWATVTVNAAAPVAGAVNATVNANSSSNPITLNITGTATSVAVSTQAAHGTATASGTSITYTPTANYSGTDSFQYTATNSGGTSAPATVSISVTIANGTVIYTLTPAYAANTSPTSTSFSYTIPSGVSYVNIEIWGAGGGGSGEASCIAGPCTYAYYGSGGGGYVKKHIAVTAGTVISGTVGVGGTGEATTSCNVIPNYGETCVYGGVAGGNTTVASPALTASGGSASGGGAATGGDTNTAGTAESGTAGGGAGNGGGNQTTLGASGTAPGGGAAGGAGNGASGKVTITAVTS